MSMRKSVLSVCNSSFFYLCVGGGTAGEEPVLKSPWIIPLLHAPMKDPELYYAWACSLYIWDVHSITRST